MTTNDLRDLWVFLAGYSYSGEKARNQVASLTPNRDYMPQDVRMLLDGIEKQDAVKVAQWLASRGVDLKRGLKLPEAIAAVIVEDYQRHLLRSCSGQLEFARNMSPPDALAKLKAAVAALESAGVTVPEEKTNVKAKVSSKPQ